MASDKVIVIGGGLAGLSAAHTVLERGGRVLLLDKQPFLGGNSTKATSGINAALTNQQVKLGIPDSVDIFLDDTASSAQGKDKTRAKEISPQARVLVMGSAPAVDWLTHSFGLDLSLISRLGGHSQPRTHRGKEKFPGMTITYALMEKLEALQSTGNAKIVMEAKVTKLLTGSDGAVIGVEYEKEGKKGTEYGPVVIATGVFAADFAADGLLAQLRPELLPLPTTNGDHCTGDGIKMSTAIGAATVDLNQVQVHPTGLVHPDEPNAKVKFLAAEALRGVGGLLLDNAGDRFCNELGTRDYVTGEMWKRKQDPYRLVLNKAGMTEIEWHCKHYAGRGLMKRFATGNDLAREMNISPAKLQATFEAYNAMGRGEKTCPFGKKFFINMPFKLEDEFWVSHVVPVLHYTMGGLQITPEAEVQKSAGGAAIPGLFAAGEVTGGVHGNNRLGGSSLLDCVVYGRVSGSSAARYLFQQSLRAVSSGGATSTAGRRIERITGQLAPGESVISASVSQAGVTTRVDVEPSTKRLTLEVSWDDGKSPVGPASVQVSGGSSSAPAPAAAASAPVEEKKAAAPAALKEYTLADVAKHNTDKDCWVVVNGQVLDVTKFLPKHPGGKPAIMLYAGKDATAEFNMLHKSDVVEKYAPDTVIGTLAGGSSSSH